MTQEERDRRRPRRTIRGMPLLAATVLSVTLTACGGSTWDKPGLTVGQWERDSYECEIQGRQAAAGSSASGIIIQELDARKYHYRCLEVRGYTRTK